MSERIELKPLWELVTGFRKLALHARNKSSYAGMNICADLLADQLHAWDETLDMKRSESGTLTIQSIRLRVLGIPARRP